MWDATAWQLKVVVEVEQEGEAYGKEEGGGADLSTVSLERLAKWLITVRSAGC